MAVTVKLRYLRHSAKKLRPFARIFKGKNVDSAIDMSAVMTNDSAKFMNKALKMAKAAAVAKEFSSSNLVISEVFATEGPKIKRMRPNARGRGNAYQKHLAHLTVSLAESKPATKKTTKTKKTETTKESA